MNENNSFLIVDLGCSYVKSILGENKVTFPSTLGNVLYLNSSDDIITYNSNSFTIGNGIYDMNINKFNKRYTIEYILSSAAKLSSDVDIKVDYLVVALPITQYQKKSADFKALLEKSKNHSFKYNNENRNLDYKNVIVLPEALCAYFTILNELDKAYNTLIIDVGGGTTDILVMDNISGKASKSVTLNIGSLKLLQDIASYIESSYPLISIVPVEKVTQYLSTGGFKYNGEVQDLSNAVSACNDNLMYIYQQLLNYYSTELSTCNVVLLDKLGIVANFLADKFPNLIHIQDSYSNAKGMEIVAKSIVSNSSSI